MPFTKGNKLWDNPKTRATWCKKGESVSPATQFKKGCSSWIKGDHEVFAGDKNPCWRGGVTPINKKIRNSDEYISWRKKVFERDNFTCQECGQHGGELHSHHIKSFSYYQELRFELSNGKTLCKNCHTKTDNFKSLANKEIQKENESARGPHISVVT